MRRAYAEARRRRRFGHPTKGYTGRQEDVVIWMQAFEISEYENVSPWDALLLAVRRRAARVRAIDKILDAAWQAHREREEGNPNVPGPEVRTWLAESRDEERLLIRASKMAIDAGVAEESLRRSKLDGKRIVDTLIAGIDVLDLEPGQRMKALAAVHNKMAEDMGVPTRNVIEIEGFGDGA